MREPRWEDEAPPEPDEDRLSWAERLAVAASYTREERRTARAVEHRRHMAGRRTPDSPGRQRPTPRRRAMWARHGERERGRAALPRGWWRAAALAPLLPPGWSPPPRRESAGSFAALFRARREAAHLGALADVPRGCMFGRCRAPACRQHPRTKRWYCGEHRAGRRGPRPGAGRAT